MKLDNNTIAVLKNFVKISPSIVVDKGNLLTTISVGRTVFARVHVVDEFPVDFAIYDLNRFLGTLSLFEQPELDFKERHVIISSGRKKVSYTYAEPGLLAKPPNRELVLKDPEVSFSLSRDDVRDVEKALGVMQLPELQFSGRNGKIYIEGASSKTGSTDIFSIEIGQCESDKAFNAIISKDNMKLLSNDYMVTLSTTAAQFVNDNVKYWIGLEPHSTFAK